MGNEEREGVTKFCFRLLMGGFNILYQEIGHTFRGS